MRSRLAVLLRRAANRLHPAPTATLSPDGGWDLHYEGVPLVHISPGTVAGTLSRRTR